MFFKSQGFDSSDNFFSSYFKNAGTASGGTKTYYTAKGSDGTYYRYTTTSSGTDNTKTAYEKYADLLKGKSGDSSTYTTYTQSTSKNASESAYQSASQPKAEETKKEDLPPKGHQIREVHHVARRTS